ncbi:hypothetical protein IRZ81_14525 [Pseudomonas putida]|uniref:Uncharacterized protein n=1 Tax=Pseudomonas putida TaxID=303 RepID=A0AAW6PI19_PSEPU|nr:hypothetical protein [Pseudomonas putida]MBF8652010.1 hypothetical protein [Pseudomonas putida]MBF8655962.1 hypothetical protein [Pseudomonas putida]MDF3869167.1 hypothetical protein [Pseudomonas putida]MDF3875138.1 hypothetical protein [Pseudomonas putida]
MEKMMVKIAEVVVELAAEGFSYTGKRTKGRVLRDETDGTYRIQVDDEVRGLDRPSSAYQSEADARAALVDYWDQCEQILKAAGAPVWKPH